MRPHANRRRLRARGPTPRDPSSDDSPSAVRLRGGLAAELEAFVAAFGRAHRLSERQIELVLLFASGLSAKEAAAAMEVDARTAAEYLSRMCVKVGVKGRNELTARLLAFALCRRRVERDVAPRAEHPTLDRRRNGHRRVTNLLELAKKRRSGNS